MKRKIFVDMDGVLADFNRHYQRTFGITPCKIKDDVDWALVQTVPNFYLNIPPMGDMNVLWAYVQKYAPTVLTGIPKKESVPNASANKMDWVKKHLGWGVPVIACRAKEKSLHAKPGDVLIDDWDKHKKLWVKAGG